MARIFISHNSNDAKEAAALKRWLTDNGWDDTFLDIDAKDGLSPGERWKDALKNAADRCEAVLCLVSPTWLASPECKLEFRYAETLRKHLFLAIIKPCNIHDLPPDWQWCPLYGDGAQTTIRFDFREQPTECSFLSEGLERLKNGLQKAGISAEYFPWPPDNDPGRAPYRGLKPLEEADAAVFFGRNAQTLHGMEALWDMRRNGIERLLVILGASGSGKSSFMRAGLLPRLKRDDRQFFTLPVIRPRNAVVFGAEGLAPALTAAFGQLGCTITLGEIEKRLNAGPEAFDALLLKLEQYLLDRIAGEADPQPPSIVFSIDQSEELFNPDGAAEAESFLALLASILVDSDTAAEPVVHSGPRERAIVVLTIRSDRYERLQTAPGLSGLKPRLFDLRPFPPGQFERVINGPAECATQAGRKLAIDSRLTERLLTDFSEGADTLPLLGFALEKLYHKYGSDGDLTLEEYETIRGSHETVQAAIFQETIDTALQEPYRPPMIPTERTEQEQGLRRAFIPFLARINPENNEPMRQVARLAEMPADVHPLVERLVEARLLIRDKDAIEVAHESLLRQWPKLRGWLTEDLDNLLLRDSIRRLADEWKKEGQRVDMLATQGERLTKAEALLATPGYVVAADSDERVYLNACAAAQQAREAAIKEEQERRIRDAEQIAEEQKKAAEAAEARRIVEEEAKVQAVEFAGRSRKQTRIARWIAFVAVISFLIAIVLGKQASDQKQAAQSALSDADFLQSAEKTKQQRVDEALAHLARAVRTTSDDRAAADRIFSLLADRRFLLPASTPHEMPGPVTDIHSIPDNRVLVAVINGSTAQVFDARSGEAVTKPIEHDGLPVQMAQISPNGKWLATACGISNTRSNTDVWPYRQLYSREPQNKSDSDKPQTNYGYGRVWNIVTGEPKTPPLKHEKAVLDIRFDATGTRVATASDDQSALVWEVATGQSVTPPLKHDASVTKVRFSPDGTRLSVVAGGLNVWDIKSAQTVWQTSQDSDKEKDSTVVEAGYSPDGLFIAAVFDVGGYDESTQRLALLNANTGKQVGTGYETSLITSYQIDQYNNVLVSDAGRYRNKDDSGGVEELSGSSGDVIASNATGGKPVASVAIAPDTSEVFIAYFDNTILWTERTRLDELPTISSTNLPEPPEHIETNASGKELITLFGPKGNTVQLWSLETYIQNSEIRSISLPPKQQPLPEFSQESETIADTSPDGRRVLKYISGSSLIVADAKTRAKLSGPITAVGGYEGVEILTAKFSPNGKLIAIGEGGDFRIGKGFARIWDAATGRPLTSPFAHQSAVSSIAFSLDNDRIVTLANLGPIGSETPLLEQIWDLRRGISLTEVLRTNANIYQGAAEFSRDQSHLTVGWSASEASDDQSVGFTEVRDVAFPKDKTLPQWLPLLAEIAGGLRINTETGVLEPLPDRWQKLETLRAELALSELDDPATRFGKWFLGNPQTRTISPYSKFSLSDFVDYCINDGSSTLLDYAEKLSVGNKELLEKIKARREGH